MMDEQKKKGGRPSKYQTHILPYLDAIKSYCRNGATLEILSQKFGVSVSSLCEYQNKYTEFSEAIKQSGEIADMVIENAMYEMAKTDKIAAMFWLKNRQARRWRDKQHVFQQSTVTQKMDYDNVSDDDLEAEMQVLDSIEGVDDIEEGGEVH